MLLSSVIIILREVLEAALLLSVLHALSKQLETSSKWIIGSVLLGLLGAILYASNVVEVSDWFEGVGQEVVNAILQLIIFVLILIFIMLATLRYNKKGFFEYSIPFLMLMMVSLAITREGSEILIYLNNFTQATNDISAVLAGSVIGASIGCSVGVIAYYFLDSLSPKWSVNSSIILLIFIAGGMISQASLLLIQADWLPSQLPLWNSGGFISEQSIVGQLLYAVLGYEATPTLIQVGFYLGGLALAIFLFLHAGKRSPHKRY